MNLYSIWIRDNNKCVGYIVGISLEAATVQIMEKLCDIPYPSISYYGQNFPFSRFGHYEICTELVNIKPGDLTWK